MFDRNQLVHLVLWPNASRAGYRLIDGEGEVIAQVKVSEPVTGAALSKVVPKGLFVDPTGCTVVTLSGDVRVRTVGEFDTAVVTERSKPTPEERLALLERRDRKRDQREALLVAENAKILEALKERSNADETAQVVEEPETVTPEPDAGLADAQAEGGEAAGSGA